MTSRKTNPKQKQVQKLLSPFGLEPSFTTFSQTRVPLPTRFHPESLQDLQEELLSLELNLSVLVSDTGSKTLKVEF